MSSRRYLVHALITGLSLLALVATVMPSHIDARTDKHVAIVVGPVSTLTATYVALAEQAAAAAERHGATVSRAYSPRASPREVLAAVDDADIVIYFGHGTGFPNPYSTALDPNKVNGWGLTGPRARGDQSDSWADGSLAYYGEAWIAAHARPAPGFVMIYSNVCYAPGAGEGTSPPSTRDEAVQRAGGYSRTPLAMGASAVFATDFYAGAATLVDGLLARPDQPYGSLFAADPRFDADGLDALAHPYAAGAELWLHRSAYFDGKVDYWYAFAGDPSASFAGGRAGALYGTRMEFSAARAGILIPGEHAAVKIGDDGAVIEERTLTIATTESVEVSARGPARERGGAWLTIDSGAWAGWSVTESATAYVAGIGASQQLTPRRYVELAPGTHAGHRFDAAGAVTEAKLLTVERASHALADAEAIINGQRHLRIAEGPLAGYWLLASDAARLGVPEPPPPVTIEPQATTGSPSPSPSPSVAAEPRIPAPPPPPPASPATTPSPSPSMPPSASPTPVPSAAATPSPKPPAATPTPSSSDTATPAPTPPSDPSATPSAPP